MRTRRSTGPAFGGAISNPDRAGDKAWIGQPPLTSFGRSITGAIWLLCVLVTSFGVPAESVSASPSDEELEPNRRLSDVGIGIGGSVYVGTITIIGNPQSVIDRHVPNSYTPGSGFGFDLGLSRLSEGGRGSSRRSRTGRASSALDPDALLEGDPGNDPTNPPTCQPVVLSSGNKIFREQDFFVGSENGLHLNRTYNKNWDTEGLFGKHWPSTFDMKLGFTYVEGPTTKECVLTPGSTECFPNNVQEIRVHRGNGARYTFVRMPSAYVFVDTKPQSIASIAQEGSNWVLRTEEQTVETYSQSGRILSVFDATGIGWVFEYNGPGGLMSRVVHTSGQDVRFTWTGNTVSSVTDPAGAVYSYTYSSGRLTGVNYPNGTGSRTYHYEISSMPNALTGVSINGVRYSNYDYHSNGKVKESGLVGGVSRSTFTYSATATTQTNAQNARFVYTFLTDSRGRKKLSRVDRSGVTNCPNVASQTVYDSGGHVDYEVDWNGNRTDYTYNAKGQLLNQTTGINNALPGRQQYTDYTWVPSTGRIRTLRTYGNSIAEPLTETIYHYTHPTGPTPGRLAIVQEYNRSSSGVPGQLRETRITYTAHPNKMIRTVTVDGPRTDISDVTVYEFDTRGFLLSVKDAANNLTSYSQHNALGQAGRIVDPNGVATSRVHNARGQLTSQTVLTSPQRTTTFQYHRLGAVERQT